MFFGGKKENRESQPSETQKNMNTFLSNKKDSDLRHTNFCLPSHVE